MDMVFSPFGGLDITRLDVHGNIALPGFNIINRLDRQGNVTFPGFNIITKLDGHKWTIGLLPLSVYYLSISVFSSTYAARPSVLTVAPISDNVSKAMLEEKELECMAKDETIQVVHHTV